MVSSGIFLFRMSTKEEYRLQVSMPKKWRKWLKEKARHEARSQASIVREAIQNYYDFEEKYEPGRGSVEGT